MVELAADHAAKALGTVGFVGILASLAARRTRLFDVALEARELSAIWPDDDDPMLPAIRAIKVNGPCPAARDALRAASGKPATAGTRLQIIACSEFSMIADSAAPGAQVIDTLGLLTHAIDKFFQPGELRRAVQDRLAKS